LAKKRGAYSRGKKKALSEDDLKEINRCIEAGESKAQIARDFHISRETLYQYLRVSA
jgi:DNA invertase Pin-like site-specific DNA recombinase